MGLARGFAGVAHNMHSLQRIANDIFDDSRHWLWTKAMSLTLWATMRSNKVEYAEHSDRKATHNTAQTLAHRPACPAHHSTFREQDCDGRVFAPWCGHCKELAPKYETAAFLASVETEPARAMARVDCDEAKNKNICLEHDVTTVPKIKVFHEGDGYDYEGGSTPKTKYMMGLSFMRSLTGHRLSPHRLSPCAASRATASGLVAESRELCSCTEEGPTRKKRRN